MIKYQNLYRVKVKPGSYGNTTSNDILELVHQFLGKLVQKYKVKQTTVYEDDPCIIILAASAFVICSNTNRLKLYTMIQLIFGQDMILRIQPKADLELIRK